MHAPHTHTHTRTHARTHARTRTRTRTHTHTHTCTHTHTRTIQARNHFVLVDMAYQGFATGDLDNDAAGPRQLVADGHDILLCQSFSKNMGLYGRWPLNYCLCACTCTCIYNLYIHCQCRLISITPCAHYGSFCNTYMYMYTL